MNVALASVALALLLAGALLLRRDRRPTLLSESEPETDVHVVELLRKRANGSRR